MTKRFLFQTASLLLCLVMLLSFATACSSKAKDDPGAYITMYLTDEIYDFDPINAYYNNDNISVLSMLYQPLFTLSSKGKIVNGLAEDYKVFENAENSEYYMDITLKDAYWSTKDQITANDVVFAWKRLIKANNVGEAASLLYDVKNARAVKQGDLSIDQLGVYPIETKKVRVYFEDSIDYDQFLLNLTSLATAPLLDRYVSVNDDWAKKPSTIATSGPFKLSKVVYAATDNKAEDDHAEQKNGTLAATKKYAEKKVSYFVLERNIYFERDIERDAIDESVTPYRLLVDCRMTDEELLQNFKDDKIFYVGNIPLSLRNDAFVKENVKISDALSTFVLYLNENVEINGKKLFADAGVREALSLAIDREAIAKEVVYAKAATALVPYGVFESGTSDEFRTGKKAVDYLGTSANIDAAKNALSKAGVNASSFSFTIKVAAYDEVHCLIAEKVKDAWNQLGFKVTVEQITTIQNNDYFKQTDSVPDDVCDDLFIEDYQQHNYEVLGMDLVAYSADAYSVLSNFAVPFSGSMSVDGDVYTAMTHNIGYSNAEYDKLMEAIYYLPYFANMPADPGEKLFANDETNPYIGFGLATKEEYVTLYNNLKAVYDSFKIIPKATDNANARAELLHSAEAMLMVDLPVIPVVFNQNANMTSSKISKVTSNYYTPSFFQKTKLKGYADYTYTDAKGNTRSIFADFPDIDWTMIGTSLATGTKSN